MVLLRSNKIGLPATIGESNCHSFIKLIHNIRSHPQQSWVLDWTRTTRIQPAGHALLASLFDEVVEHQTKLQNWHLKKSLQDYQIIKNLMRIQDFKTLPKPDIHHDEGQTFTHDGGRQFILSGAEDTLNIFFMDHVKAQFHDILDEDLEFSCRLLFNELMQNAVDHSTSERYYLYAGRVADEFHVGVLDQGVTIPAKLETKYPCENDMAYLALAFEEGISTRRRRQGGLGLSHTFDLIKESGGTLILISRRAQIRRYFRNKKVVRSELRRPLYGTWCFARFPLKGVRK